MSRNEFYRSAEEAAKALCALYRQWGYRHYRMSKFEEYDFYARNKNFLVSSNIITFTDLDGKLMALKPDVTLSIVKNAVWGKGSSEKVYYTEKVYRAEKDSREFREITQTGLECVGDLGLYDIAEVLMLAVRSLQSISEESVLDISHLGFVSGLLSHAGTGEDDAAEILRCIGEKNVPELRALCLEKGISEQYRERLEQLARLYGSLDALLPELRQMSVNEETENALRQLEDIAGVLRTAGLSGRVNLDFSIVNDMNYYNGIIFRGFVKGIPQGILAGGSYDHLLSKMEKNANAVGFALYLDQLERLYEPERRPDADVLITYEPGVPVERIVRAGEDCFARGLSVRVQKADDGSVTAAEKIHLSAKEDGGNGNA